MPKQAPAMPPRPQEADIFSFRNEPPPPTFDDVFDPQTEAMSEWGALESELDAIGAPTTTATSAPAPAPTAQSEYMIIPPPVPTGGAGTCPQPRVQPPSPSYPPPPANPPPSFSGFDDLSDVFSGSRALTSLYENQPQAPPTFAPPP
ncbi:PREDICTED: wiskott-Aldrich syndrome protein family member 2-like [Amphimedon queenslandica]|nr:PREDICTED: wiskott-Aldrich syndrome protein family member 2-like [Amphimedon queenslandica]|eukprot:XP_019857945.1 PREDICTED: wiskott-Aldrich syndrome protein family member 2-like [Amphimedon queenslandica]